MIDKLKTFVSKNRGKFDSKEPKKDLWEKIDAKMEAKNSSMISSNWLSKLKYLGLSASVLIVVIYFISKNLNNSSASELTQNRNDSAMNSSGKWIKTVQNRPEENNDPNNSPKEQSNSSDKNKSVSAIQASSNKEQTQVLQNIEAKNKKDSVSINSKAPETNISEQNKIKTEEVNHPVPKEENPNDLANKKEENLVGKNNKNEIVAPAEPEKINSYSATIYDGSSLCEMLRIYKFPGQVSMDGTMKTTGCSRLENITNMKAIWVKGKTNKKIQVEVKEGFKNIKLVKSNGKEVIPEAISHYYKGLGVIAAYTGKNFYLFFKDKVELILFFKDVEEGDKIVIDETIETFVKNKP